MPRTTTTGVRFNRLDSDAETLRFPEGGVFGRGRQPENRFRIGVPDVSNEITRTLARMQDQINRIRDEVDPSGNHDLHDSWPPKAA